MRMTMTQTSTTEDYAGYSYRRVGTAGCEIRNPTGEVIAWTVDELWAIKIVQLLNNHDVEK
jgi:hypothetical protein